MEKIEYFNLQKRKAVFKLTKSQRKYIKIFTRSNVIEIIVKERVLYGDGKKFNLCCQMVYQSDF